MGGFSIIDVTDISNPKLVSQEKIISVEDVLVADKYLFLACAWWGIKIFDISNPFLPVLLSSLKTPGSAEDIFVKGDLAFLAGGKAGLLIIDISDLENPKLLENFNLSGFAERLFMKENYIFLTLKGKSILATRNLPIENGGSFQIIKIIK